MNLKRLNASSFDQKILEDSEFCLVVFTKRSCHACKEVIPLLTEMSAGDNLAFDFYIVNIDEDKDLAKKFALRGIPTILFFKHGVLKGKLAGNLQEKQINQKFFEAFHSCNEK